MGVDLAERGHERRLGPVHPLQEWAPRRRARPRARVDPDRGVRAGIARSPPTRGRPRPRPPASEPCRPDSSRGTRARADADRPTGTSRLRSRCRRAPRGARSPDRTASPERGGASWASNTIRSRTPHRPRRRTGSGSPILARDGEGVSNFGKSCRRSPRRRDRESSVLGVYAGVRDHMLRRLRRPGIRRRDPQLDGRLERADLVRAFAAPYNSNWSPLIPSHSGERRARRPESGALRLDERPSIPRCAPRPLLVAFGELTGCWLETAFVAAVFAGHICSTSSPSPGSRSAKEVLGRRLLDGRTGRLPPPSGLNRDGAHPASSSACSRALEGHGRRPSHHAASCSTSGPSPAWKRAGSFAARSSRSCPRRRCGRGPRSSPSGPDEALGANASARHASPHGCSMSSARMRSTRPKLSGRPARLLHPFPSEAMLWSASTFAAQATVGGVTALALAARRRNPAFTMGWPVPAVLSSHDRARARRAVRRTPTRHVNVVKTGLAVILAFRCPTRSLPGFGRRACDGACERARPSRAGR